MTKAPTGKETLPQIEKVLGEIADNCNNAIENGSLTDELLAQFPIWEKAYADQMALAVYRELGKADNPKIAAVKRHSFEVLRHKETRDTESKRITKVEIVSKTKQIQLDKFCKAVKLDTGWVIEASAFNQSMCLWAAQELGYSEIELKQLAKSYYLQKQVREIASGKTPTSNNALCKALQKVIDAFLPTETENSINVYKCNNHDIAYLKMCYMKKGRETLGLAVSKDGYLRSLIADILHRIVENKRYNLEYKAVQEKTEKPAPKTQVKAKAKLQATTKKVARKSADKKVIPAVSEIDDLDISWLDNSVDLGIAIAA